jgi:glycosyltransferase involved in cell wall biosynthesis
VLSKYSAIGHLSQSPLNAVRYRRWFRKAFLFAALRTRSTAIREELSQLACGCSVAELFERIEPELVIGQASFDPYKAASSHRPHPPILRFRRLAEVRDCLFDLAWLLSNQEAIDGDAERAHQLYMWLRLRFGAKAISRMHRIDWVMLATRTGEALPQEIYLRLPSRTLADLLRWWAPRKLASIQTQAMLEGLNTGFRRRRDWSVPLALLRLDLQNPWRTKKSSAAAEEAWIASFGALLFPKNSAQLVLDSNSENSPFDRLETRTDSDKSITDSGELVTVVVSCYQPSEMLVTAVRSVLRSTHQNLEILVIDDASPAPSSQILETVAALDPRVQVLRQQANGGTYRIRNRALDEARGEYITFHDSDDWMHPERIARQLSQLKKSKHPANVSMSMRCSQELALSESSRRFRIGICEPSILFNRKQVVRKIGYFDPVRKGADSEFRQRLQRAFAIQLEVVNPFRVLTLQRGDNGGLTAGDLGYRWITEFRLAYRDSFQSWHRSKQRLYIENSEQRQFFAPRQMRFPNSAASAPREFDLILAANFCDPINFESALAVIAKAKDEKKSVACWQIYGIYPLQQERSLNRRFLELLNEGAVSTIYPADQIQAKELRLIAPSAYLNSHRPLNFAWNIDSIEIEAAPESWQETSESAHRVVTQLAQLDFAN